jgi:3-polyprenyl-4-hydroxybenzoate decarboxylase
MTLQKMAVVRQQISNTHQWTNCEAVFSTRSVRQLRDTTMYELLEDTFSALPVLRLYKQDKSRI